jgi:hypothetical protein
MAKAVVRKKSWESKEEARKRIMEKVILFGKKRSLTLSGRNNEEGRVIRERYHQNITVILCSDSRDKVSSKDSY